MALAKYVCPSKGCTESMRVLRGSIVGHICQWNKNRWTQWFMEKTEAESGR